MTTFGGGALVCKSEKHQKEGLFLATQAKNSAPHYEHSVIGFNYVMSDLLAGVGREQMEYLEKYIALRRLNNVFYENIFKQIPGITLLKEPNSAYFSTHWLSCILIDPQITSFTSKELRLHLEANNIESRPLWKPMHLQPIFSGYRHYGSDFSEYIFKNGLCLPSSSNLQETDKKRIFTSIQEFVSEKSLHTLNYSINKPSKISEQATLNATLDLYIQAKTVIHSSLESNLKRRLTFFENPVIASEVNNKVVLVTGAAGSIGSEISRQLSSYNLELLILIDQAESPLYDLQQELLQNGENSYGENSFKAVVADVRDYKRMEAVFAKYKPQKVFHAAAYKHVPLMENSPYEAVKINICGTKNIADLSLKYEVERFVMVSTDKAVNPSNVMGATKRVAELYVSCLSNEKSDTKFTITRFGNVLGSNGSVIPLFKKQIENGGPLTLTHKDITRYFMTISEACRLVLEASIMGDGGETYIFDMGKSVKIFDLAKRIIFLSGFAYPEEIDIKITGLRPGEKLHEELLASGAHTIKTSHKKIRIASSPVIAYAKVKKEIIRLTEENRLLNDHTIVAVLKEIVPEYISNNSIFENLDKTSTR
jgi:FlaA1/EpsC-like NDP-sugar epimerase